MSQGDFELIEDYERELASAEGRQNKERLEKLIPDDFEEIGSYGAIYLKKDILLNLPKVRNIRYSLENFSFRKLQNECILVKCSSRLEEVSALRTSIWVKEGNEWKLLHHQSTVLPN